MIKHPTNKKMLARPSDRGGMEISIDGGNEWFFTFRTANEIRANWQVPASPDAQEDRDRETMGETLDDPIPDDLWESLS